MGYILLLGFILEMVGKVCLVWDSVVICNVICDIYMDVCFFIVKILISCFLFVCLLFFLFVFV